MITSKTAVTAAHAWSVSLKIYLLMIRMDPDRSMALDTPKLPDAPVKLIIR
jgi:hypothetical protein